MSLVIACLSLLAFSAAPSSSFADDIAPENHFGFRASRAAELEQFDSARRFGFEMGRPAQCISIDPASLKGVPRADAERYRSALQTYASLAARQPKRAKPEAKRSFAPSASAPELAAPGQRLLTQYEQFSRKASAVTADLIRGAYQQFFAPGEADAAETTEPARLEDIERYVKWKYRPTPDALDHF